MNASATIPRPYAPTADGDEWSLFPESFAATCHELKTRKCAPSVLTWMPFGCHCIRPIGKPGVSVVVVKPATALIANRHLQIMRAKAATGQGPSPFFDFDHEGGRAGEPLEFFWDESRGVAALVGWSGEGVDAILSGRCNSFSPTWNELGGDFLGLRANMGALLSSGSKPAFEKMPRIVPIPQLNDVRRLNTLFLRRIDRRALELKKTGQSDYPFVEAFEGVKVACPELFQAHQLMEAIGAEFRLDLAL